MEFQPTSRPVAAEALEIDLSGELTPSQIASIRDALHRHSILVFRRQTLSPQRLVSLTRALDLGELKVPGAGLQASLPQHPEILVLSNILRDGQPIGVQRSGEYWHAGSSYAKKPSGYGLWYAVTVPKDNNGAPLGDTLFASVIHAHDTLPESVKKEIRNKRIVHFMNNRFRIKKDKSFTQQTNIFPVSHPLVRVHPATSRHCLNVNQQYAERVEGLSELESRRLIDDLCRHIVRDESVYRHSWHEGDLVISDDCAIQHCSFGDYELPQEKLMYRTIVEGDVPR